MNNEKSELLESLHKFLDGEPMIENKNLFHCPICNETLVYMEADINVLYCKKCEKFFKINKESIIEEIPNPFTDKNAKY